MAIDTLRLIWNWMCTFGSILISIVNKIIWNKHMLASGGHACWKGSKLHNITFLLHSIAVWWFICQKILQIFFLFLFISCQTPLRIFFLFILSAHCRDLIEAELKEWKGFFSRLQCLLTFHALRLTAFSYLYEIINDGMQIIKIYEEFF